jgi:hypothetical protein
VRFGADFERLAATTAADRAALLKRLKAALKS